MTPRLIYVPGGGDSACDEDAYEELDCMVLCVDDVMVATDVLQPRPAAFREGEFVVNRVVAKLFTNNGVHHRSA